MKIRGSQKSNAVNQVSRSREQSGIFAFDFSESLPVQALSIVDQREDSFTVSLSGEERVIEQGLRILDSLDEFFHHALEKGGVPESKLRALVAQLDGVSEEGLAEPLKELIHEVRLRARVELAKWGK